MPLFRYYVIQVRPVVNSAAIVLYCAAMLKNVRQSYMSLRQTCKVLKI